MKDNEQPRIAIDGTKHTVRTADNKSLHRKLISSPIDSQRSPKNNLSPNKHKLRGPGGKYVSASERTGLMVEGINSESRPNVWKMDSDAEDSNFECYDRSEGIPVHDEIDKGTAEGNMLVMKYGMIMA